MFTKLIRGILGLLGIMKRSKKFTTVNNAEFMANIEPGEIILVGPGGAPLSNGIATAEDGFWSHALIHIGKDWAQRMRINYPYICGNTKVGRDSTDAEIIEAEGTGIQIDTLHKYDGAQLVGFSTKLSDAQLEKLFLWLYKQVGRPYGYLTFLTELYPNPSDIPVKDPGWICSGLCAYDYFSQLGIYLANPKINPAQADPEDLYNGLEPKLLWSRNYLNCEMGD